jgi:hypothetical protein
MATCYICSSSYASNRREVYTGQSHRVNYGRRVSFGNSQYYGMRSVCDDCAYRIDIRRNLRVVFWQCVAIAVLLYCYLK